MRVLIIVALLMVMTATRATAVLQKTGADGTVPTVQKSAPTLPEGQVLLDGKPLLAIKSKVLSFSPEDRARTISSRLATLVKDPFFRVDMVKVVDGATSSDIIAGDKILMSVTESDATAEGKPRLALAEEYAGRIRTAVEARNKEFSMRSILFGALYSFLATVVLLASLWSINHFLPKIISKFESWRGTYIRSIRVQSI